MKAVLLLILVSQGASNYGTTETIQYSMMDRAHCESVKEYIDEIFTIDPIPGVDVATRCIEVPK